MGKVGAFIAFGFLYVFGLSAYVLPVFSLVLGILLIIRRPPARLWLKIALLAILVLTGSCILSIQTGLPLAKWFPYLHPDKGIGYGGMLGQKIGQELLATNLGRIGSSLVLIVAFLASLMLITEVEIYPYLAFFGRLGRGLVAFGRAEIQREMGVIQRIPTGRKGGKEIPKGPEEVLREILAKEGPGRRRG